MEFQELIRKRQSVRKYSDRPVETEKLEILSQAVRLAPSASNSQPWKLIWVTEPELREKVARATFSKAVSFNKFALQAPVLAVLCVEKPPLLTQLGAWVQKREYPLIDIGIAASHLCLQAAELGLGTCMLGWFDEGKIKSLLKIPEKTRIGLVVTVGYAPDDYPLRSKKRKAFSEVVSYNQY
ncbi:MAG: nitroreductase family protein [Calditrichia bacterium]